MLDILAIPHAPVRDALTTVLQVFANENAQISLEGQEIVILIPGKNKNVTLRMLNVCPTEDSKQIISIHSVRTDGQPEPQWSIDALRQICETINNTSKLIKLEIIE